MQKIIGVTELQRRFRVVFDEVVTQRVPYVLTRGSRPEAVLLPYAEYLGLQESRDREVRERLDAVLRRMAQRNAGVTDEQAADDVAKALAEVRSHRKR